MDCIPLKICYEDAYLLIINKPPGLLVHPTVKEWDNTLYAMVAAYYKDNSYSCKSHPVSRLDRNTSGLVIFAKEPSVQAYLAKQPAIKRYLAIVHGQPACQSGSIYAPIARKEGSIIERCVSTHGKQAQTDIKVRYTNHGYSLLELELKTGRTHQIRVHLAYMGLPLVDDNLYGTPGPQGRHALHAYYLQFTHPVTGTCVEISAALPEDLRKIIYY